MADDKKQLILDLLARNKMRKDTQDAADDLDKLGRAAEDADKKTEHLGETGDKTEKQTGKLGDTAEDAAGKTGKLGEETGKAAKETDKLGNSLADTKGRISGLDREIENVDKELKGLAGSFADAGSAAERNDISRAIRRTQTELRNLTKNRDALKSILPDDQEVEQEGKKLKDRLGSLFSSIGEMGGPEIATGIAAAAPFVGAVLSGAIIGGVGLGGIVGGVLIATKDARVKGAFDGLRDDIGAELKGAAEPFVPVTVGAIGRIQDALHKINFNGIFADAAKQAGPLIDGVVSMITKLGTSIGVLIHNSGPEVAAIGSGITKIGDALGNGLEEISSNGKASTQALNDFFSLVSGGITVVFKLVDGLTKVYGALHDSGEAIGELVGDGLKQLGVQGEAVHGTITKVSSAEVEAAVSTNKLSESQKSAAAAEKEHEKAAKDLNDALKAQVDPDFALLKATDDVRDAQKAVTDANRKYGSSSRQAQEATRNLAEAAITLQGAATGAGGSINGRLTPSMRNTLKAAGLTKSQIAAVAAQLKAAKKAADAYAKKYYAEIITNYTYNVGGNDYNREANRGAFSGKRAAGGPVVRGVPYLVGENGPEIVVPDASGRVLSAGASRGLVAQGAVAGLRGQSGGGGFPRRLQLEVVGGDARLVSLLKYLIRSANLLES